ncbi:hypothetical protein [Alicyclobacillus herbarius]|uniref:hypothetical protein n=1 Tax=Alicyclobacillus herbarius TaxID=122960 RepID=UPI000420BF74|nr:hypothetical protein [Alicyclobacillus herbarius]
MAKRRKKSTPQSVEFQDKPDYAWDPLDDSSPSERQRKNQPDHEHGGKVVQPTPAASLREALPESVLQQLQDLHREVEQQAALTQPVGRSGGKKSARTKPTGKRHDEKSELGAEDEEPTFAELFSPDTETEEPSFAELLRESRLDWRKFK